MKNYYSPNSYPPYRFSPFAYRNYNYYRRNRINQDKKVENLQEKKETSFNEENPGNSSRDSESYSNPVFELFGIQLFFDDILLISLIFFLYNEGVQDQFLFIALVLLLLS